MMPSKLHRRNVLATVGTGCALALSGCIENFGSTVVRDDRRACLSPPEPAPGTWPLPRYDFQNRGYNPDASPSRDEPSIDAEIDVGRRIDDVVIGRDHLAVAGDGLDVYDAETHTNLHSSDGQVRALAWEASEESTLYSISYDGEDSVVQKRSFDGEDANEDFRIVHRSDRLSSVLPVGSTLLVGSDLDHRLYALDGASGEQMTAADGTFAAVEDETLFVTALEQCRAYQSDCTQAGNLESFDSSWNVQTRALPEPPVVAGEHVLAATRGVPSADGGLFVVDATTGEISMDGFELGRNVNAPAVVDATAYPSGNVDDFRSGTLQRVDLDDRSVEWTAEADWGITATVATGNDLVLAAGRDGPDGRGVVGAYDASSGDERWSIRFESPVTSILAVEDSIYVGTRAGTVTVHS